MKAIFLSITMIFFFLLAKPQLPRMVVPTYNNSNIQDFQVSPDGKILAFKDDYKIRLIDIRTGSQLIDIEDPNAEEKAGFLAFGISNDNLKLAILQKDKTILFWDITSGKSVAKSKFQLSSNLYITDWKISFSDDDKIVYIISKALFEVYDFNTGSLLFKGAPGLDFLGNRNAILTSTSSPSYVRDIPSKFGLPFKYYCLNVEVVNLNQREYLENPLPITKGGFSNDGRFAFVNALYGSLFLYNLENKQIKRSAINFFDSTRFETLNCASFSPGSDKLLTVSKNNTIKVWDTKTGTLLLKLEKALYHPKYYSGDMIAKYVQFCDEGSSLVFFSTDNNIEIVDIKTGTIIKNQKINKNNGMFGYQESDIIQLKVLPDDKKYISATGEVSFKLWDTENDEPINDYNQKKGGISQAHFLDDDKSIAAFCLPQDYKMGIIDIAQSSIIGDKDNFDKTANASNSFAKYTKHDLITFTRNAGDTSKYLDSLFNILPGVSSTLNYILYQFQYFNLFTGNQNNIYDYRLKKKVVVLENCNEELRFTLSPDNSLIASQNKLKFGVWDLKTGKLLYNIDKASKEYSVDIDFSYDNKMIYLHEYKKNVKIIDAVSGAILNELIPEQNESEDLLSNCNDEKIIFRASPSKKVIIRSIPDGKITATLPVPVSYAKFSKDCSKIMTANSDINHKEMTIWDAKTLKKVKAFMLPGTPLDETTNARYIICLENDKLNLYDTKREKIICTYILFDGVDLLTLVPSGYYKSATAAAKNLYYVTPDLKVISFEQLDVRFNRPDKVLYESGSTDTSLINSYRRAYEKRVKKLGIDTTSFRQGYTVPDADIINRNSIKRDQFDSKLKLHIKGTDKAYLLDRYNIWINECPLFGQRGINIRNQNTRKFDTTITIELSYGKNKIETSVFNTNGAESYRMPIIVNYNPLSMQKPTVHFVGIGIDEFADSKYSLQYSTKDIRDLSLKLKDKFGKDILIDTLFNEEVSVEKVRELKKKLLLTTENDKVIIAYSGHGVLSKNFDYYLSTYSMNFEKPELGGLSYDDLENLVDGIPARKKLMLIDACHSGEFDKEDLVAIDNIYDSLHKGIKPVTYKQNVKHLGLKNSFELMQSLFVNVGKGTGAVIISAAAGTQFALESGNLKNGVFTFSILEAMDKYPALKISELKKIVTERVEQITNGLQRPTSRNETIAVDWDIW